MNQSYLARSDALVDGDQQSIEKCLRLRRVISAKARCHNAGILKKSCRLFVFILRNKLAGCVNSLAILLDGNAYDAGETFCGIFLSSSRTAGRHQKNEGGEAGLDT